MNAFADLKDIHEVEPLNAADEPCLNEIRDVLAKHGLLDRFGITLLHSHFPVADGESLVEFCIPETRELLFRTIPDHALSEGTVYETSWRLYASGKPGPGWTCSTKCVTSNGKHENKHVWFPPVRG